MNKLQSIRKSKGLTRTKAAAEIGMECGKNVAYSSLYMWERNKAIPPLDVVLAMGIVYNIELPELVNAILG